MVLFSTIETVARGINVGVTHAAIDLVGNPFCPGDGRRDVATGENVSPSATLAGDSAKFLEENEVR